MRISALSSPQHWKGGRCAGCCCTPVRPWYPVLGRSFKARLHFVEVHGHTAPGDLPGGFTPGQSAANDLYAHQSSSSSGLGRMFCSGRFRWRTGAPPHPACRLFHHIAAAFGTAVHDGLFPADKITIRIVFAAVEPAVLLAGLFHQPRAALGAGRVNVMDDGPWRCGRPENWDRPGIFRSVPFYRPSSRHIFRRARC